MKVRIGRLQNLISSSCIEHLDFMSHTELPESCEKAFSQIHHEYIGYQSLTDVPRAQTYTEQKISCDEFNNRSTPDIIVAIHSTDSIYCKCQLWGILLNREGPDYEVINLINFFLVKNLILIFFYR